jgi:hypothetical protein
MLNWSSLYFLYWICVGNINITCVNHTWAKFKSISDNITILSSLRERSLNLANVNKFCRKSENVPNLPFCCQSFEIEIGNIFWQIRDDSSLHWPNVVDTWSLSCVVGGLCWVFFVPIAQQYNIALACFVNMRIATCQSAAWNPSEKKWIC